jgi:hypothetical protein
MPIISPSFDERAARRVLDHGDNAVEAALALFERHTPATLSEAAQLIEQHGPVTPAAFDAVAQAFDIYWHLRDMPLD